MYCSCVARVLAGHQHSVLFVALLLSKTPMIRHSVVVLFCRYFMLGGAIVILGLGLPSRPDTSIMTWAKRQAKKELDEAA